MYMPSISTKRGTCVIFPPSKRLKRCVFNLRPGLLTIIYRLSAIIGDNRIAIIKLSIIVIAIKTYSALSLSRYDNFAGYRIIER